MLLSGHIRAGRAILRISQEELAKISEVSVVTIKRLESEDEEIAANYSTIKKIKKSLEEMGIRFLQPEEDNEVNGFGVRYYKPQKKS
jgi:predicted transcriptional regulator